LTDHGRIRPNYDLNGRRWRCRRRLKEREKEEEVEEEVEEEALEDSRHAGDRPARLVSRNRKASR
jgi:hypothetical protein